MKRKAIIIIMSVVMGFPVLGHGQTKQKEIKATLAKFVRAFQEKNMDKVHECLAEDFSIGVVSWPAAKGYFEPVMSHGEAVKDIEFVSVRSKDKDGVLINVIFKGNNNAESKTSIIGLDNNYKIRFSDYLDRLFGYSRYNESKLVAEIPFRQEDGGSIVIPLRINGSEDVYNFLFDSGADGMAIRRTLADTLGLQVSRTNTASIVGGQMQIQVSGGNKVQLTENFSLTNQSIALFDKVRHGLDGLIGLNLATGYITKVDFDRKVISLYTFGDFKYEDEGVTLPVSVPRSVMLFPVSIDIVGKGAVKGDFVFDTGANYSLIAFSRFVRQNKLLLSGFKPEAEGATASMGHVTPTFMGKARKVSVAPEISYSDFPVTLMTTAPGSADDVNAPAGSIGIELIGKFNFTIDLLRKQVHLVTREVE